MFLVLDLFLGLNGDERQNKLVDDCEMECEQLEHPGARFFIDLMAEAEKPDSAEVTLIFPQRNEAARTFALPVHQCVYCFPPKQDGSTATTD